MNSYIIVIAGFAIVVSVLIAYFYKQKKKKENARLESLSNPDRIFYTIVLDMINKDFLAEELDNLSSFDNFKLAAKEKIFVKISDMHSDKTLKLSRNDTINYQLSELLNAAENIIDNDKQAQDKFVSVFNNKISENIKEAENIEKEAVEYHKQFGEEPVDDPVLHPAEKSNEETYDMEEKSLDELIKAGAVEDETN